MSRTASFRALPRLSLGDATVAYAPGVPVFVSRNSVEYIVFPRLCFGLVCLRPLSSSGNVASLASDWRFSFHPVRLRTPTPRLRVTRCVRIGGGAAAVAAAAAAATAAAGVHCRLAFGKTGSAHAVCAGATALGLRGCSFGLNASTRISWPVKGDQTYPLLSARNFPTLATHVSAVGDREAGSSSKI